MKKKVLKGLVVREYYPQPEQRSMSDADIFVKAKELNKSKKILITSSSDLGASSSSRTSSRNPAAAKKSKVISLAASAMLQANSFAYSFKSSKRKSLFIFNFPFLSCLSYATSVESGIILASGFFALLSS